MNLTLPRQTRATRRAQDFANPETKRAKMRQWVALLGGVLGAKNGANDEAVRFAIAKYEPYIRAHNPKTKDLDFAFKALRSYYFGVFEDVAVYVSETNNQEAIVTDGRF